MTTSAIAVDAAPYRNERPNWVEYWSITSGYTRKFQVRLNPSTELPVIKDTERMATSGTTKKRASQAAEGRPRT